MSLSKKDVDNMIDFYSKHEKQDVKKYIVKWLTEEEEFEDVQEATNFAEKTGLETGSNAYVYSVINGNREKEPFFKCEWEF